MALLHCCSRRGSTNSHHRAGLFLLVTYVWSVWLLLTPLSMFHNTHGHHTNTYTQRRVSGQHYHMTPTTTKQWRLYTVHVSNYIYLLWEHFPCLSEVYLQPVIRCFYHNTSHCCYNYEVTPQATNTTVRRYYRNEEEDIKETELQPSLPKAYKPLVCFSIPIPHRNTHTHTPTHIHTHTHTHKAQQHNLVILQRV